MRENKAESDAPDAVEAPIKLKVGQLVDLESYTAWRHDQIDRTRDSNGLKKFSKFKLQAAYNGLACPKCGCEMYDPYAQLWIPGHYPQNWTGCSVCNFRTHRPV